jgi:hypothetical protein
MQTLDFRLSLAVIIRILTVIDDHCMLLILNFHQFIVESFSEELMRSCETVAVLLRFQKRKEL